MSDTTIQEEMEQNQWKVGDECFCRVDFDGVSWVCLFIVKNVDIPTRRLELIWPDGYEGWFYMEKCWKESK